MVSPAAELLVRWRSDPVSMVREIWKAEPDEWQADGLRAFARPDKKKLKLALSACAGPGKSCLLAWCGINFLMTWGTVEDHAKGAAISCNWDNLRDNLWSELRHWIEASPITMGRLLFTSERISDKWAPGTRFISARGYAKAAGLDEQGRSLSGLHAPNVLILIDESGDMPPAIGRTAEQAMANAGWGRIVQAGNPTSHDGLLYETVTKLRHEWELITITGDPEDPKRSPRIDIEWAREQIRNHGRDNPWVMSYILGKFPPTAFNALLSPDEVQAATLRPVPLDQYIFAQKRIGVDVARFGDDATVIYPRQGLVAFLPVEMRGAKTQDIAARVAIAKQRFGAEVVFVDATGGWGAGVIDALGLARIRAVPVDFSGKADDEKFFNKRTEMWWRLAEWVKKGGSLPDDRQLARELTVPTYFFERGKIRLEEKDQIKKRLGFSPDHADALAETFCYVEQPAAVSQVGVKPERGALVQSDPLEG